MAAHTSRVGQRVDQIEANDDPHDMYRQDGTPVLIDTEIGRVVEKQVICYTVTCPDCGVPARYDHQAEPICPECGLICDGRQGHPIRREATTIIDPKTAGRTNGKAPS